MHLRFAFLFILTLSAALIPDQARAFEVGTLQNSTTVPLRGQSFVPSQAGGTPVPDYPPPHSTADKAYLHEVELRFDNAADAPPQVFVYDQIPTSAMAAVGEGALGAAQKKFCFDSPAQCFYGTDALELDFDATYHLVLSACTALVTSSAGMADDYPAGTPLISGDCATSGEGNIVPVAGDFDLAFAVRFLNAFPNVVADYRAGQMGLSAVAGAPPLSGQDFTAVSSELIDGRLTPVHPMDGNLQLDVNGLLSDANYSVAVLLRLADTSGYRKLLDFADRQSDAGLYVLDSRLHFFPGPTAPEADVQPDTWVQATLTRSVLGRVSARVDDRPQFSFDDAMDRQAVLSSARKLTFFSDDAVTGGAESPSGAWSRIRVFNNPGRGSMAGLVALPDQGPDSFENDNLPLRADLGLSGAGASFRTFHSSDDEDWLYASVECDTPNYWNAGQAGAGNTLLYSDDPRFQPLVEYYPQAALANPMTPPSFTAGACGQAQRLLLPPTNDSFIRLRNCPQVPIADGDPIEYRIEKLDPDVGVCAAAVLITGTVTEAGSGAPVGGLFVLGDDNSSGFTNPANGTYRILVTDFTRMTLAIVSAIWEAPPATLDEIEDQVMTGGTLVVDFQVTRKGAIFSNTFEQTNPFDF